MTVVVAVVCAALAGAAGAGAGRRCNVLVGRCWTSGGRCPEADLGCGRRGGDLAAVMVCVDAVGARKWERVWVGAQRDTEGHRGQTKWKREGNKGSCREGVCG